MERERLYLGMCFVVILTIFLIRFIMFMLFLWQIGSAYLWPVLGS